MSTANGDAPPLDPRLPYHFRRIERAVENVLSLRQEALSRVIGGDPRRDIADECGYNKTPSVRDYHDLYDREPVADKVVSFWPRETWQVTPEVYEEEEADTVTPFEAAWDALGRDLAGADGLFESEEGSPVWEYLRRVDVLSGIGHYGILLLGLDDGLPLDQPAAGVEEANSYPAGKAGGAAYDPGMNRRYSLTVNAAATRGRKLLYVRAFAEVHAEIVAYETNFTSPRFGQPALYRVTFSADVSDSLASATRPQAARDVHWTRVIHVADTYHQPGGSEVLAVPRLLPVLDPVTDIRKVRASSAEMYYRGAFPGVVLKSPPAPELGGDTNIDEDATRDMMEKWANGLQRKLLLLGMEAEFPAPQVVDPTPQIEAQERAICVKMDVPWRIWQGSERGELASSQDQKGWNKRVAARQRGYVTPRLVQPFVSRLVQLGVLPRPKLACCEWPEVGSMTDLEKANVCLVKTQALAAYVAGGVESVVPPLDYLTRYMGESTEEAQATLQAAADQAEATLQRDIQRTQAKIEAGVMPDPTAPRVPPPGVPASKPPVGNEVTLPGGKVSEPAAEPLPITSRPHRAVIDVTRDGGEISRIVKSYEPLPEGQP